MYNSFLLQFLVALALEVIRKRYLPFSKIVQIGGSAKPQAPSPAEMPSELDGEITSVRRELAEMRAEAEKLNNPDTYAKYGKLQRQIVQKEKVLAIMMKESAEEKAKRE